MSEVKLTVRTFRMGTDKEAALKPLEESAEAFGEWQLVNACGNSSQCRECNIRSICAGPTDFADEIADCIQACVNLADRYGIDLQAAMELCEKRNRERGRYE